MFTSYIQRRLSHIIKSKIVEAMEEQGVVSAANHVGKREILILRYNWIIDLGILKNKFKFF